MAERKERVTREVKKTVKPEKVEEYDLHPDDPEPGCYPTPAYVPFDEDDNW